ncbi:MAG: hypothetical protein QGH40_01530 [bacterium]|nr:hypothetical protein [bacterium]
MYLRASVKGVVDQVMMDRVAGRVAGRVVVAVAGRVAVAVAVATPAAAAAILVVGQLVAAQLLTYLPAPAPV